MPQISELLDRNRRYAEQFHDPGVPLRPARQATVVTCMDARIDVHALLGLQLGDLHIIRNGGGAVTDDVIRSLAISQRKLGTRQVLLIHHTDCGMLTLTDDEFLAELQAETGVRPSWAVEAFTDIDADVRQCAERVRRSPFLTLTERLRGFVYDVDTGLLREVDLSGHATA